ncbi:hypothetical protein C0995_015399 [Termitomyces sp. Mi166|nr:hypothetical protein C0995_015399 [Termitomyces sp. Mi166\
MPGLLYMTGPTTFVNASFGGRNYDYTKIYSPDNPGDEATENARVWNVYLDEAENYDADMIQGFRNIIDGLLVFAALFSAVVTTFVAQTSQALQPDNTQITVSLLFEISQLLRAIGNSTEMSAVPAAALDPGNRTYSSTDVWVNGLFFTSLSLSLSTALLTVLAKQWIQAYAAIVPGGAKTRAMIRHFRFQGLTKWKLGRVIEILPLVLHSSVAIFFVGLALYVSQLSSPLCGVVSIITALTFVFYFGTSMLPAFDIACPYRIPFMFSLAKPLVFGLRAARYAYLNLRNKFTRVQDLKWPEMSTKSLKIEEQNQVFPIFHHSWDTSAASRVCSPLDWVFNHSSNQSVKNVVVEAVCALLEEWNSNEDFQDSVYDVVSSPEHSNLFLSAAKYSLSQLSETPPPSTTEHELEQSTCGKLIRNLMKLSSSESLLDGGFANLKNWREEIERVLILAYSTAVSSRYHALSRRLLDWGQPMFRSTRGTPILFACAQGGDAENIRDLVNRGINLNHRDSREHGWTALHYAALAGNLDGVIALVERKPGLVSVQAKHLFDSKPCTALDLAIDFGKSNVVAYLLDHGAIAPPNALHVAVQAYWVHPERHLPMVELFLDRGWDRTAKDADGRTAMDIARSMGPRFRAIIGHLKEYQTVRLPPDIAVSLTSIPNGEAT